MEEEDRKLIATRADKNLRMSHPSYAAGLILQLDGKVFLFARIV
jgi:hypothetical protein